MKTFLKAIIIVVLFTTLFFSNLFGQHHFSLALYFDGNENFVEIPDDSILTFGTEYTMEFWIKMNDSEYFSLINNWAPDFDWCRRGFSLSLNGFYDAPFESFLHYPGVINFRVQTSAGGTCTGSEGSLGGIKTESMEIWNHIAISTNLTKNEQVLYIDGEKQRSTLFDGADYNTPGYSLNIGGFPIAPDLTTFHFFGLIDEVRIWNIARTDIQIQTTMNDTLSFDYYALPDSGLIAYYRFDQLENLGIGGDDIADDIRDFSFYKNHGDVIGNANLVPSTITVSLESNDFEIPVIYKLSQNYPNPFNPSTTIEFSLPKSEFVELKVFNILGKEVASLVSKKLNQGNHTYQFDGSNLASGIYYYQLVAGDYREVKKMILLR